MRVNSEVAIWKAEEQKPGMMAESMKETLRMEKRTEKVLSSGQTETNTLVAGELISNMVSVSTTMSKMPQRSKENGLTESDTTGFLD
jgi:hypothetical protein